MQSLKFSTSSFADEKLSEQFCDIVINAALNNVDKDNCNIHILLEHKSYKDKNLNVQILAYLVNILQNQISTKTYPELIFPVVLYHGKQQWKFTNLRKDFKQKYKDHLSFVPDFDVIFIDLSGYSDEVIQRIGNTFLASILFVQKYAKSPTELRNKIDKIFNSLDPNKSRN